MATFVPSNPHFFQPLLPGFEHQFSIPTSFFKFLKGQACEKATLRSPFDQNKLWHVKINGRKFEDGWKEFVETHDLDVGYFLVFEHVGNMVFDVLVFDLSACQKEYSNSFQVKEEIVEEEEEEEAVAAAAATEEEVEEIYQEEEEVARESTFEKSKRIRVNRTSFEAYAEIKHPYFEVTLTSSKQGKLPIPMRFARLHNLNNRCCKMLILDQMDMSWPVNLFFTKSQYPQGYIGRGWTACRKANSLKRGDSLFFQLVKNREEPVFKLSKERIEIQEEEKEAATAAEEEDDNDEEIAKKTATMSDGSEKLNMMEKLPMANLEAKVSYSPDRPKKLRKNQNPMTNLKAKASSAVEHLEELKKQQQMNKLKADSSSVIEDSPHLEINLTSSSYSRSLVYINENYVKLHSLRSRSNDIILVDQEGRDWPAKLRKSRRGGFIFGWQAFHAANDLRPEETLSFKLTENGNRSVFKLCSRKIIKKKRLSMSEGIMKSKARSTLKCPHFVARVTSSSIRRSELYMPSKFSKINNLKNGYEMVLMNQEGRSWPVRIWTKSSKQTYIRDWNNFRVPNDIKLGDSLIFMLIEKGKRPVVKVCGFNGNEHIRPSKRTSSSSMRNPYFYDTIKECSFQNHCIKIPRNFAMKYGFGDYSEMIIENEKGESWSVSVARDKFGTFRIRECIEFIIENGLEIGSVFMLELEKKRDNKPVMKFYEFKGL